MRFLTVAYSRTDCYLFVSEEVCNILYFKKFLLLIIGGHWRRPSSIIGEQAPAVPNLSLRP